MTMCGPLQMTTRLSAALLAVQELLYPFVGVLYVAANREGGPEDVSGGDGTDELLMSDSGQPHGGDATASGAVGVAAELAGFDTSLEIG
jgi:hypothetical protein